MNQKIIITIRIFAPEKAECDIEVPLDITAYELFCGLKEAFRLKNTPFEKEACFLCSESPVAFLTGDNTLEEYHLRDGTIINLVPPNTEHSENTPEYLKNFDFTKISFNCAVDLSARAEITIGNSAGCSLVTAKLNQPDVKITVSNRDNHFFITANKYFPVFHNGKLKVLSAEPFPLKRFSFLNINSYCFYFNAGKLYYDKKSHIQLVGISGEELTESIGAMRYPEFVRNSRLKLKINDEPVTLLAPKEKPTKPKNNMFLRLMPAVGMIALSILLRGVMGGSNMFFILFSVCSTAMGAIVSVLTIRDNQKEYAQQVMERQIGYKKYIEEKKSEIEEMRKEELKLLDRIYYSYAETSGFAKNFSGSMFDRVPEDEDFLEVRIGTGTVDAVRKIDYKPHEKYEADEDELVDLPLKVSEDYKKIKNAPIILQLKSANVIGVVGNDDLLYEMMKIMYFDLCIRQHYDDVTTVLIADQNAPEKFGWIKWFKHINHPNFRNIVCDNQSKSVVFEYLYSELNQRSESKQKEYLPHIVVFVMNDFGINRHPVSKYIKNASDYGATFLFFENYRDYIPLGCSQLVLMDTDSTGRIIKNENTEIIDFNYTKIKDSDLYAISYKLAPVYCQEVSLEGSLTKSITFYQLLGIQSESMLNFEQLWKNSDVTKSLSVPIGVRSGNEVIYLDIHDGENSHGPHGLVAGTTGSGKSELLMTYILSMAVHFSPMEVAFLIIDFKAGGMADHFRELPHTLGIITNIDGKEIQRSLVSIEAEIERRQKLFSNAKEKVGSVVNHIDQYISAWKKGILNVPLPHLLIIVDEFAELKAHCPEFMEAFESIATIGRTLGVHLILATQRPAGQIPSKIDVNSKFRLCLKVQSLEDSRDMIKTPLASEIREAGRAYFMVQNSDVMDLVQTAYSSAPSNSEKNADQKEFSISSVNFTGRRTVIYQKKHEKLSDDEKMFTQNKAVVASINAYCTAHHIAKLPNICQPPLLKMLEYVPAQQPDTTGIYINLGIFDDPVNQRQEVYTVNLAAQNMLIIGALQTGKTNALQLIIRSLAENYTPEEVNIYIIDYSSMILTQFSDLPHVGGVVTPNENEKLNNLFKMLTNEISVRKQKLKGISYMSYREAGHQDMPLMLLLIDNFTSLKELSLNDSPVLQKILSEGLSVGISVAVANATVKGLEYKYLASFSCKIGLYHNNTEEYSTLFGAFKLSVDSIAGRCLVMVDKKNQDCQLYQSFAGEKENEKIKNMEKFVKKISAVYPDRKAAFIPQIPEFLHENQVRKQYHSYFSRYQIILGFDYDTLLPRTLQLSGLNLIISGTPKSGKGNFIQYLISCVQKQLSNAPAKIVIFDKATSKKLESAAKSNSCVEHYELSTEHMTSICSEWKQELESRKKLVLEHSGDMSVLDEKPLLMMIFEDSNKDMMQSFDEKLLDYTAYKFSWIASNVINDEISPMKTPKLFQAKKAGADFLLFGSVQASKLFDSFSKIPIIRRDSRLNGEPKPGDAFLTEYADPTKVYRIKTVLHE